MLRVENIANTSNFSRLSKNPPIFRVFLRKAHCHYDKTKDQLRSPDLRSTCQEAFLQRKMFSNLPAISDTGSERRNFPQKRLPLPPIFCCFYVRAGLPHPDVMAR
jgi:hypothetical protein